MFTWIVLSFGFLAMNATGITQPITKSYEYDIWPQEYVMTMMEVQTELSGDAENTYLQNQQAEQEKIIVDGFFDRTNRLWPINYALWCAGAYTPPKRDGTKRVQVCSSKSFDCSGLLRYYGMRKWILEKWDGYRKSTDLFTLGVPKNPMEAKRWDFIYFQAMVSDTQDHIWIVPKDYSGNGLWILDNIVGKEEARQLIASCNSKYCSYLGKYRIYVATNGFVELAKQKNIIVQKYITDRSIIDYKVRQYLNKHWAWQLADSFISYGHQNNVKPELAVCIANSETWLGKKMLLTGNIANIHSHQWLTFDTIDLWIQALYTMWINGTYLINKQTVGDLYTNWDCQIDCWKAYAQGKWAQDNVLNCLSSMYNQEVDADFSFRTK